MTKRDQTVRAWISRPGNSGKWVSYVSFRGKRHELCTGSTIRDAALQFNLAHCIETIAPPAPIDMPVHIQPDLFAL